MDIDDLLRVVAHIRQRRKLRALVLARVLKALLASSHEGDARLELDDIFRFRHPRVHRIDSALLRHVLVFNEMGQKTTEHFSRWLPKRAKIF